ncbi:MAG: prolipoprotein diacylglyceryl transferase [Rhodocyclaceae bacterium]|jgi:protein-S-isoprenylcysteine O-methyltransferase Ste14|nr:prolipoprotein diacylglyceryl transferase [Rhodocyclaceae bacterium]
MGIARFAGKLGYGTLFIVLWPGLLALLAWRMDTSSIAFWPQPFPAWAGAALAICGIVCIAASIWTLWSKGHGLPMNAFPPSQYVSTSTYAIFAHPIYFGFTLAVAGASILASSAGGLWIVTPLSALAATALVVGYEGPKLQERFGNPTSYPLLGLPPADDTIAPLSRRLAAGTIALTPWALAYATFSLLPAPDDAKDLRLAYEYGLPRPAWTMWLYSLAYPFVIASPFVLRTHAELRRFVVGAWTATISGYALMILMPGKADLLSSNYSGFTAMLAHANRSLDADWLALPSFHVIWSVFAAYCFSRRWPLLKGLWWLLAAGIAVSCITTGSHAVIDVPAGILLGIVCWQIDRIWSWLIRVCERLSNSWGAIEIGPVRVISHAIWSALAASVGTALALFLAGPGHVVNTAIVVVAGLLSAGAWGYWLEGGGRLSRPFGYYGFLCGAMAALGLLGILHGDAVPLVAGFAAAAPLAQAIGRLRCLVQGCCHGKAVVRASGLRVSHPMSRVVALANLGGISIHATQLYSIVGNLIITLVLLRFWAIGASWNLIAGLYLALSSMARFAEERYRGEPQTSFHFGLTIYQWLAVTFFLAGCGVTMLHGGVVTAVHELTWAVGLVSVLAGILAAFCMSVDFPKSHSRFSRLTVAVK